MVENPRRGRNRRRGGPPPGRKKASAPPPPQTKVTLRHIGNAEKYGTVKSLIEMLRQVLEKVSQENSSSFVFEMDSTAATHLIKNEEAVLRAKAEAKKKLEAVDEGTETSQDLEASTEEQVGTQENASASTDPADVVMPQLEVIVPPKTPSTTPKILVRPMYATPPRMTSRRGERGGCFYVVLVSPTIAERNPVKPEPSVHGEPEKAMSETNLPTRDESTTFDATSLELSAVDEARESKDSMSVTTSEKDSAKADSGSNKVAKAEAAEPRVDYSKDIAKGRLLLIDAIDALKEYMAQDAKKDQRYAGCIVEISPSGKTFRPQTRVDKREGSVESSGDFKTWLANQARQAEALKSRPKPAPGGVSVATGLSTSESQTEEKLSALVLHLRAKHAEAARKKAKKKKDGFVAKSKNGNAKSAGGSANKKKNKGKKGNQNFGGGPKNADGSQKKKGPKKGGRKTSANGAKGPPAAALKPRG